MNSNRNYLGRNYFAELLKMLTITIFQFANFCCLNEWMHVHCTSTHNMKSVFDPGPKN